MRRCSALYGDCDRALPIEAVDVQATTGSMAIQKCADLTRKSQDRRHDVETAWLRLSIGNGLPAPVVDQRCRRSLLGKRSR